MCSGQYIHASSAKDWAYWSSFLQWVAICCEDCAKEGIAISRCQRLPGVASFRHFVGEINNV